MAVVLVVDDDAKVELVDSGRVVPVVLEVLALAVEDVVVALGNVELVVLAGPVLETVTGSTMTIPNIPF